MLRCQRRPLLRLLVQIFRASPRHRIDFPVALTGSEDDLEIASYKLVDIAQLLTRIVVLRSEVLEGLVVGEDLDRQRSIFQLWSPMLETTNDR